MTTPTIAEIVGKQTPIPTRPFQTTDKLRTYILQFCQLYNVTPEQLASGRRTAPIAEMRQILYYLCYHRLRLPFTVIAQVFSRHHTTVMHGVQVIANRIQTEPPFADYINRLPLFIDFGEQETYPYPGGVRLRLVGNEL